MITVAKGIANGFPMSGLLISPEFKAVHGMLGTTFGGNHLACAAALAVLDVIEQEKLIDNAARVGDFLIKECQSLAQIKEVRGLGLMIGLEFDKSIKELRKNLLFEHHVFTGVSGSNVIRLLPPLSLSMGQAALLMEKLRLA
jgi:acetylornithine aminotransferase